MFTFVKKRNSFLFAAFFSFKENPISTCTYFGTYLKVHFEKNIKSFQSQCPSVKSVRNSRTNINTFASSFGFHDFRRLQAVLPTILKSENFDISVIYFVGFFYYARCAVTDCSCVKYNCN